MLGGLRTAALVVAFLALLALPAGAAAKAEISSKPEDAIAVLSGDVVVGPQETVDGVYVISGDVRIAGHVTGDVVVLDGDLLVTGKIDGDLYTASSGTRIERGEIGGDVNYADERPDISRGSLVGGEVERLDWPDIGGGALSFFGGIIVWLAITVSLAILGALLILLAPRAADAISARDRERAGPKIAIGIALGIGLPIALVLAAVTVLGLPLAGLLALSMLPLWAVAYCAAAYALGRRILGPPRERILSFLVGLGILQLAGLVPLLDLVIGLAAGVYGLGLLGTAIGAARNPQPGDPLPAQIPDS